MIESLFPCPVGNYELDRDLTQKEITYLKKLSLEPNVGNLSSVSGDVLKHKEVTNINKFCIDKLNEYCHHVWGVDNNTISITQSWTNKTIPGAYHHQHWHHNSIVSGVFYFDGNDDSDSIRFFNHQNWLGETFTLPLKEDNLFNTLSWWLPTPSGKLYLFPSRLEHCVNEVQGVKDRWSLSFNTFTDDTFSKSLLKKLYKGKIVL
tara:strand:- start:556 stop:1170 length:615 start_codon:yes stop_codon:yes gene_type:complete